MDSRRPRSAFKSGIPFLETRVKHIPQGTIKKKWRKLPPHAHDTARAVILSARDQTTAQRTNARSRTHTQTCVNQATSKLTDQLPKIPFPPGTDENHFDLEYNINHVSKLGDQLATNTHFMELLRAQIAKEEAFLELDRKELSYLEHNSRTAEAVNRDRTRSLHPAAKQLGQSKSCVDSPSLHDQTTRLRLSPDLLRQGELERTIHLLQHHLTSIDHNIADISVVKESIQLAENDVHLFKALRPND